MTNLLEEYFTSKKYAWSPSTFKSERYRLLTISPLIDGIPERLWESLKDKAPYSRLTTWVRACDYYDWLLEEGHKEGINPYRKFKKRNRRLFKNAYKRKTPKITYQEAIKRIQTISDNAVREKAMELLTNGFRYTESFFQDQDGVTGKGNKWRRTFKECEGKSSDYKESYTKFYRALRKIGLRPHDLRKLFATECYRKGLSEVDLCEVMGWSSFETARSYIAAKKEEDIKRIIHEC